MGGWRLRLSPSPRRCVPRQPLPAGAAAPHPLLLPSHSPPTPNCSAPPGSRRQLELQLLIPRYKEALSKAKAAAFTAQGVLADPDLMGEVLMYYR